MMNMIIFDAHCDTAAEILDLKTGLRTNSCHADLERIHSAGSWVQVFAAFVDPVVYRNSELSRALQIIDNIYRQAEANCDLMTVCTSVSEINRAVNENKLAALISIEGGEALQGELAALRMFYRLGVRSLCLTWNYRNALADGAREEASEGGLSGFGRSVVEEMNRLGMLVDVSHISENGFWDVLEYSKAPVIASHSNSKTVCNHPRNLTDDQLKALKANGGVAGINLYPNFLTNTEAASIDDIIRHIEHIAALTGDEHIGLGCDFDGIECTPSDIKGVQDIHKIFERLLTLNYSEGFIEKFASGNFMRTAAKVIG
jgi:membrane dipeptidase